MCAYIHVYMYVSTKYIIPAYRYSATMALGFDKILTEYTQPHATALYTLGSLVWGNPK